jgi:NCS1 family nucleobase:cation symporter-1
LAAWLVSAVFVVVALKCGWMHPFFLFLPTFLIAGVAYLLFAGLCGAGRDIPENVRRDVDAVEARIAELSEQEAAAQRTRQQDAGAVRLRRRFPMFGVLAAVMLAILAVGAVCAPQRFKQSAIVYTALYFAFAAASAVAGRGHRK